MITNFQRAALLDLSIPMVKQALDLARAKKTKEQFKPPFKSTQIEMLLLIKVDQKLGRAQIKLIFNLIY